MSLQLLSPPTFKPCNTIAILLLLKRNTQLYNPYNLTTSLWSDLKVTKWIGREKNHHHIFLVLYLPYRREVAYTTTTCWSRTLERTLWIHPHANQTLVEHATMRWMWQLTLEAWLSCVNTNFLHSNNVLPLFRISNLSWIVILLYYWFLLCFIMWFGLDNIHWMNIYAEYFNLPYDEILYIGGGA